MTVQNNVFDALKRNSAISCEARVGVINGKNYTSKDKWIILT